MSGTDAVRPHPPAPWELRGEAHVHVFLVPRERLPRTPPGFRPLLLFGHGVVAAGWVDYRAGSVLRYHELFTAVAGRGAGQLTATVTHMWVDSAASRAGGRALWGYPKELAPFRLRTAGGTTCWAATGLAKGSYRPRLALPVHLRGHTGTVQWHDDALTPVRAIVRFRPSLGGGHLEIPADSPLAFLRSGRRVAALGLHDFHFTFGI